MNLALSASTPPVRPLLADYRAQADTWDEMLEPGGAVRPAWQPLVSSLADIDRTLELEPHHFGALAGLGLDNIELDRDEAALDAFERVLKVTPQSQSARHNIEIVKQRIKDKSI